MNKEYDIDCPYCQAGLDIKHYDGYGREEDELHQQECRYCQKIFTYTTSIIYVYNAQKADCLNDGQHKYESTKSLRCADCGDEIPPKEVLTAYENPTKSKEIG